jgi:hypothetical protein
MRLTLRSILFAYLLILTFCFLPVRVEGADNPGSVMDMIPDDSLAYVSLSNLEVVYQSVIESSEWQELLGIKGLEEDLDQAKQVLSFGPMLVGISLEDLLNSFGHETVLTFMGMMGPMPVAGLIANPGAYMEQLEYAVEQLATLPTLTGQVMLEEKEYRDVPYTAIGNKDFKVKYGFLDNFLLAGLNGGFEKLVDFYKDGGRSIKDTPNFQFMQQKVSLSSNICIYADPERAAPLLEMFAGMASAEEGEENKMNAMMTELALKSVKAFALCLNLSGHTQEVYLHLRPDEPNPITDLALAPHSPMSALDLIPLADGAMVGIHIGDLVELLDRGLKLAESLGAGTEEIEGQIQQLEDGLQLNLRDDLLSALTGEIAVMAMLPKGDVDLKKDKFQMAMQLAKTRSAVLIGVKDEKKLEKATRKLLKLANLEPLSLGEQSYKGAKIRTKVVPLDILAPGLAVMPSYSFRDGLLVMSNSAEWVQDTIDLLESSQATEVRGRLSESRVLMYLDVAGIANFVMKQNLIENIKPSKPAQDKLAALGSVAVSLSLGPDGVGVKLISTSEDDWMTKILRGILVGIYVKVPPEQKEAEQKEAEEVE